MKFKTAVLIPVILFVMLLSSVAFGGSHVRVVVDGEGVEFDKQNPIIEEGRVLVPIRNVSDALGFNVDWDGRTQEIKITQDKDGLLKSINMKLGDKKIWTKTRTKSEKKSTFKNVELDVPLRAINGRTMLPIRAVSEIMGFDVKWNQDLNTVIINQQPFNKSDKDFTISHYSKGKSTKLNDAKVGNAMLDALSNSFDSYSLAVLDEQIEDMYKEDNFIELKFDENKEVKVGSSSIKLKKMTISLSSSNRYSEGMLFTWDEVGKFQAWAIDKNSFKKVEDAIK